MYPFGKITIEWPFERSKVATFVVTGQMCDKIAQYIEEYEREERRAKKARLFANGQLLNNGGTE